MYGRNLLVVSQLFGCGTAALPESLPPTSPVRADAPVAAPGPVAAVLADADPLAWPPLAPASGGHHHHHGAGSQPTTLPVVPGSQPTTLPVAPATHGAHP
jgi:hypothetical protein